MKSITVPVYHLRDMIESAVLACAKDNILPTLTAIYFEWEPGQFSLATTDRYKLIWATLPCPGVTDEHTGFLLQKEDALALAKMLPKKPARSSFAPECQIQLDEHKAVFLFEGGMATFETYDAEFPKYRTLIPSEFKGVDNIAFNVDYLGILSKFKNVPKVWDFSFVGPSKPMVAKSHPDMATDPSYFVMIMPVRRVK